MSYALVNQKMCCCGLKKNGGLIKRVRDENSIVMR